MGKIRDRALGGEDKEEPKHTDCRLFLISQATSSVRPKAVFLSFTHGHHVNMIEDKETRGMDLPEEAPNNLVTEGLLSWARDVRYVSLIANSIGEAVEPHLNLATGLESKTWYISYLIYVMCVVQSKGRSLGMEATGLQFLSKGTMMRPALALAFVGGASWALDALCSEENQEVDADRLRGHDRRRRHHLLRRQMLERSSGESSRTTQVSSPDESANGTSSARTSGKTYPQLAYMTFKKSFRTMLQSFSRASLDSPNVLGASTHGMQAAAPRSILTWMLRLHSALFLLKGTHPSLLHRVLGLQHERFDGPNRVVATPGHYRIIALLIVLKGSSAIARYVIKAVTDQIALYLEHSSENGKNEDADRSSSVQPRQSTIGGSRCSICRTPRLRPAASRRCGHVFCYSCIHHWVASVKEACPYCRSPCSLEDIQPLYNYDQPMQNVDA